MNIETAINKAKYLLKIKNIKSPGLDSELLMSKVLKKNRSYILLNLDENLKKKSLNNFLNLVKERSRGKPIAYLIEKKEFWDYEFKIKEGVLIPRPDTEIMVEQILDLTKNKQKLRILDIGTGSGCIILSILKERKNYKGIGIDISKKCIDMCKINTFTLNLTNQVKFFKSDVDNFVDAKYDLIISNPPYINQIDLKCLEKDVYDFEPKSSLDGGIDGLSEIRKIIDKSSELIKIKGKLILEIAFDQKFKVKKLLNDKGFYVNKVLKDLANNDRCIISTKI
ncbi:peptide chain release factor N(5)-glutamine methyltransferase [Candidatus Pelagibacter sp.]|nr:peptide chain release factor N(5)-glutamine methyltransferase [Candidatus Pelagibacter sp.]